MNKRTQIQPVASSDEWYTPRWIIEELGPFDLDPCSPLHPPYEIAPLSFNKEQDGLRSAWPAEALVFMNPPYSQPLLRHFVEKMAVHNNGIALLKNQVDNLLFQEVIFPTAMSMIFMRHRVKFIRQDGSSGSPFFGSCLVAWGQECDRRLQKCNIEGKYVVLNTPYFRKRIQLKFG